MNNHQFVVLGNFYTTSSTQNAHLIQMEVYKIHQYMSRQDTKRQERSTLRNRVEIKKKKCSVLYVLKVFPLPVKTLKTKKSRRKHDPFLKIRLSHFFIRFLLNGFPLPFTSLTFVRCNFLMFFQETGNQGPIDSVNVIFSSSTSPAYTSARI